MNRGVKTFLQHRSRHTKKVCANLNSETSKSFVAAMKCIMDNKFAVYNKADSLFANRVAEIERLNFRDSATELKYLCCSLVELRRDMSDNLGAQCSQHKLVVEEMASSIITSDLSLICEDKEKLLAEVCPSIKPLNVTGNFNPSSSPSITTLYLIATLGEPEEKDN